MGRLASRLSLLVLTLSLGGCFQKADVSEYVSRAREYTQAGDTGKARVELLKALKLKPFDPQANYALATAEEASGNIQAAIAYYARAAAPDARLLPAQLRFIEILIDSERYQDAMGRVNLTLGVAPNNPQALALKADIEERQGSLPSARDDALLALRGEPENARALAVLASLDLRDKNTAGAIQLIQRGLTKHPDDFRLLQVQAVAMLTVNEPQKATDALQAIVRAQPNNVSAQRALAELESRNGNFDQAVQTFQSAAKADPTNQDMQLSFVGFLASQKKTTDVVSYLQGLIAKYPTNEIYDLTLAGFLLGQNDPTQAKSVLQAAITRLGETPGGANVRTALAELLAQEGHIDLAQAQLAAIFKFDARSEKALLLQATLQLQNGRADLAVTNLLDLLRANPVNGRAYQLLANAYLAQGDAKAATEAMRRAVAVLPGDDKAQIDLATFLYTVGKVDESRDIMLRLTLSRPSNPTVWSANGQLAILRKDWNAVTRSLDRLRELPGTASATAALSARAALAMGKNDEAIQSFKTLISAGGDLEPSVFGQFARASVDAGQMEQSASFLEAKAPTLKPELQNQAWSAVMTLQADAQHFDKALAAFAKAQALNPKDSDLYLTAAKILVAQGQVEKANVVVQQGMRAGAPRWAMLMLDGAIKNSVGDLKGAMQSYHEATDDNPYSIQALNNYASTLADVDPKNIEALKEVRTKLNGLDQVDNGSVIDTIAWVDYRLGRFDEAKQLLIKANAAESSRPQLKFHLGAVLLATGEREQGLALLNAVKGLTFPGSQEAQSLSAS